MKRNTTPTLKIKINLPFENINSIEFVFKKEKNDYAAVLLHKVIAVADINIQPGDTSECFTVLLPLTAEETMKLPAGSVYMDTRLVLSNNVIPETEVVHFNVDETLFSEVFSGD